VSRAADYTVHVPDASSASLAAARRYITAALDGAPKATGRAITPDGTVVLYYARGKWSTPRGGKP
jgi:hypothetical protein